MMHLEIDDDYCFDKLDCLSLDLLSVIKYFHNANNFVDSEDEEDYKGLLKKFIECGFCEVIVLKEEINGYLGGVSLTPDGEEEYKRLKEKREIIYSSS